MGEPSRAEEKLAELHSGLVSALRAGVNDFGAPTLEAAAVAVLERGVSLTEPECPHRSLELLTARASSARDEAASTRPGHICLRLGEVLEACCSGALTVAGITQPWLLPLAVLLLWRAVWRSATVELTADEATAVIALWELSRKGGVQPTFDAVFGRTNSRRAEGGMRPLSKQRLRKVLGNLMELGSIEQRTDGTYRVVEWIRVSYR